MSTAQTLLKLSLAGPYVRFCWDHLSKREHATLREIHEESKVEDWWPIKAGLDWLERMGLAEERDWPPNVRPSLGRAWVLTDFGKKVRDAQAAMVEVRAV